MCVSQDVRGVCWGGGEVVLFVFGLGMLGAWLEMRLIVRMKMMLQDEMK